MAVHGEHRGYTARLVFVSVYIQCRQFREGKVGADDRHKRVPPCHAAALNGSIQTHNYHNPNYKVWLQPLSKSLLHPQHLLSLRVSGRGCRLTRSQSSPAQSTGTYSCSLLAAKDHTVVRPAQRRLGDEYGPSSDDS
jgi:hypothetical protein